MNNARIESIINAAEQVCASFTRPALFREVSASTNKVAIATGSGVGDVSHMLADLQLATGAQRVDAVTRGGNTVIAFDFTPPNPKHAKEALLNQAFEGW